MENILKMMLFEIIYNELNLNEIDKTLLAQHVPCKKMNNHGKYPILSRYFVLVNDVTLNRLTEEEKSTLINYMENINNPSVKKQTYDFLRKNKLKLLLPETTEPYLYWGPTSFEYMAPSDAIVLGFHYIEFDSETHSLEKEEMIQKCLNNIQEERSESVGYKVSVIKYNEIDTTKSVIL